MTMLQDVTLTTIDGDTTTLEAFAGQVLLVVNVASHCELTPQYAALEALYRKYRDEGFAVLGFPSNDFAGQEPGSEAEIADFCTSRYDVTFPLFHKTAVAGPDKHPLFAALIAALPSASGAGTMRERLAGHGVAVAEEPELLWNFEKFVIGRDGTPVARFAPDVTPDDAALMKAVEQELFASE